MSCLQILVCQQSGFCLLRLHTKHICRSNAAVCMSIKRRPRNANWSHAYCRIELLARQCIRFPGATLSMCCTYEAAMSGSALLAVAIFFADKEPLRYLSTAVQKVRLWSLRPLLLSYYFQKVVFLQQHILYMYIIHNNGVEQELNHLLGSSHDTSVIQRRYTWML